MRTLGELRRESVCTLIEVADKNGIPPDELIRYEYDAEDMPISQAHKMSKFYGVSLDSIKCKPDIKHKKNA